ncbi:MAG: hypothetical protein QME79_07825 [Bacillota bacterium]|nr:hypothetical protein [Bacillota bacterium]
MSYCDRDGRIRILFADAYDTLARQGIITAGQAEAVKELVDRLEEFTPAELECRLAEVFPAGPAGDPEDGSAGQAP